MQPSHKSYSQWDTLVSCCLSVYCMVDKKEQTIVTKGDANNSEDGAISYGSVIGKASNFSIPYLGKISTEYQNGNGKIITVVCIVVLLGVSFLLDLVKKQTDLEEGEE